MNNGRENYVALWPAPEELQAVLNTPDMKMSTRALSSRAVDSGGQIQVWLRDLSAAEALASARLAPLMLMLMRAVWAHVSPRLD